MNTKLIQKLNRLEIEIESVMDAMESTFSVVEENKLSKVLDKLNRDKAKIKRKIERHEETS
ncbi:hypothetical protein DRO61_08510 [Candidatus Bathyarchaeota archaeon]|nr:MAG: hypothetical protein DRO61_08510 [Candidatus Bathyarchaeota archaeon]